MVANASGGPGPGDWRRKRNLRIAFGATALVVVLLAITFWPRSGGVDDLATAPSSESTTTLDTTPFRLLQPDGPTTIPPGVLETTSTTRLEPTTTRPPTTLPPTTTTTLPPTTTTLPIPGKQSDKACQAVVELITLARRISNTTTTSSARRVAVTRLKTIASLLRQADAAKYRPAILVMDDRVNQLEQAGTREEIAAIISGLLNDPSPDIAHAFDPVVEHAYAVCPEVLAAR